MSIIAPDMRTFHDFSFLSHLGQGAYGLVCKVKDRKTGTIYALKIQSLTKLTESSVDYREEIKIQSRVIHPHIITLHGWFIGPAPSKKWRSVHEDVIGSNDQCVYMILDFATGGELLGYMTKNILNEATILAIGKQLASAIAYCHTAKIIHRDIKLENVLIDSFIDGIPQVKISDFGLATTKAEMSDCVGTIHYMAPEVCKGSKYTKEVDLWSLGVLIYELSQRKFPFDVDKSMVANSLYSQEDIDEELMDLIVKGEVNLTPIKSERIKEIISVLLNIEPSQRVLYRKTK